MANALLDQALCFLPSSSSFSTEERIVVVLLEAQNTNDKINLKTQLERWGVKSPERSLWSEPDPDEGAKTQISRFGRLVDHELV